MASRASVAIEKEGAIGRINAVLERVAAEMGHEYAPLPTQGRDADIVTKNQLVHIADALDRIFEMPIVEALEGEMPPEDDEKLPFEDGDRDEEDADMFAPPADDRTDVERQMNALRPKKGTKNAKS